MQSLFFFLPLFSAQPAQPTSLSLSFFFFSRGPNSPLSPAHLSSPAKPSPMPPPFPFSAADRWAPPVGVVSLA